MSLEDTLAPRGSPRYEDGRKVTSQPRIDAKSSIWGALPTGDIEDLLKLAKLQKASRYISSFLNLLGQPPT